MESDMLMSVDSANKKRKLLEESYVLIERLKKLRALNGNPRLVGINPRLQQAIDRRR